MADLLAASCDWLATYGLELSGTRIASYRECLNTLGEHYDNGTLDYVDKDMSFPQMVEAVWESSELIRAYEGLSPVVSSELGEKLTLFIKGPKSRDQTVANDPGRDIAFELNVAARFARAGFEIDFGTNADLKVSLPDCTLFVECKRPKSEKKMDRHISKAIKQLYSRYASVSKGKTAKGILALSLGMVINPDSHLLSARTSEALDGKVRMFLDAFMLRHQNRWMKRVKLDGYTLGVLMTLDIPTLIEEKHLLTMYHELALNNTCASAGADMALFTDIGQRLKLT